MLLLIGHKLLYRGVQVGLELLLGILFGRKVIEIFLLCLGKFVLILRIVENIGDSVDANLLHHSLPGILARSHIGDESSRARVFGEEVSQALRLIAGLIVIIVIIVNLTVQSLVVGIFALRITGAEPFFEFTAVSGRCLILSHLHYALWCVVSYFPQI